MPACPFLFQRLRAAALGLALLAGLVPAQAAGWTVLLADDAPGHAEFARELRVAQPSAELLRLPMAAAPDPAEAEDERTAANAGVRTRSLRPTAMPERLTVAVGAAAARAALERGGSEPLLLAMLSRLDYEGLRPLPALRVPGRRIGVLLREPSFADQLALIDAVLPGRRRLGLVATAESEPMLRELQRAAAGGDWSLQVEQAPDALSLAGALRAVMPRSEALLVLPDAIGSSQAATLAVLHAGASAGVPVFGSNEGIVRSGALAAAVSTPALLARQAQAMGRRLAAAGGSTPVPVVESASPAVARVNPNVARSLGLALPAEQVLTERLAGQR